MPIGLFPLAELVPGIRHQRHVAASLPLAVVGADGVAAAAQPFAIILSAARMLFGRGTTTLAAAIVLPIFAKLLAVIEPAAQMDVAGSRRDGLRCFRATAAWIAARDPGCQAAYRSGREPMKITPIQGGICHVNDF